MAFAGPSIVNTVEIVTPQHGCTPDDVRTFLLSRRWHRYKTCTGEDPDFWKRSSDENAMLYTWEQAVAVEFMNFVTLGGPPRA